MHIKLECFLIELCVNAKKKFVQVICYSMTRIYIQLPKRLSHTYSIPFLLLVYSALHVYYPQFLNSFLFSVFSFPFFFQLIQQVLLITHTCQHLSPDTLH